MNMLCRFSDRSRASWTLLVPALCWLNGWFALPTTLNAAETSAAEALWSAHVQPLLSQHCFKCHGELKQKNNLDLTSPAAIFKGGDSGPALVPGQPEQSLLF